MWIWASSRQSARFIMRLPVHCYSQVSCHISDEIKTCSSCRFFSIIYQNICECEKVCMKQTPHLKEEDNVCKSNKKLCVLIIMHNNINSNTDFVLQILFTALYKCACLNFDMAQWIFFFIFIFNANWTSNQSEKKSKESHFIHQGEWKLNNKNLLI